MSQHAKEANGKDPRVSEEGLRVLREGLPIMRKLETRSSVAKQGLMFYEELVSKSERFSNGVESQVDLQGTLTTNDISTLESNVSFPDVSLDAGSNSGFPETDSM